MDGGRGLKSAENGRQRRRWRFAAREFDEGQWALFVDGRQVLVEVKPLELLRQLLLRPGEVLSKAELLDAVWPDVSVVEASLSTAVLKLRRALGDDDRDSPIVETVPRIGYRLAVPAEIVAATAPIDAEPTDAALQPESSPSDVPPPAVRNRAKTIRNVLVGVGVVAAAVAAIAFWPWSLGPVGIATADAAQPDAVHAIRTMDVERLRAMIQAGWDPNTPFDNEGNGALNLLLETCEWDRAHDRLKLLLAARTLIDGGARLDRRNVWGDTPYSIAVAPRYCGSDHPVTRMIATLCSGNARTPTEACMAAPPR